MSDRPKVWIMIKIDIEVHENPDRRFTGVEHFDGVTIIQDDTREELLARCYGIRERAKQFAPKSPHDSGRTIQFVGPFEVEHNHAYAVGSSIETCFEYFLVLDEKIISEAIDTGAVLHQLLK